MNVIILCGGLSTRLGDITKATPKILLPIGGKSVLDWQLEKLKVMGITNVVMAAGHLADVLKNEVGEERKGIRLTYAIEPERLGTGGAIKHAFSQVADPDASTLILNGDILTTVDIAHLASQLQPQSEGLILGSRVPDASNYGTLVYDDSGHLQSFREKEGKAEPGYINGGIYLFTRQAHKYFPAQSAFSIEYDVFPRMKDIYVYESDQPWIDIGVPERRQWARENWQNFL